MKRGDIIRGRRTYHPIIFLRRINEDQFAGCILTHSNDESYQDNIKLNPEHFMTMDSNGRRFHTKYDESYFVAIELIKEQEWGPFTKTGQLSLLGIEYVTTQLRILKPQKWSDYMEN